MAGTYADDLDDQVVEEKAFDICKADGNDDPERMTYENDGGIPYPWGPLWGHYINDAIEALRRK